MTELLKNYFNNDELAASVWANKYKYGDEQTPDDMHRRMAKEFYRIEKNYSDIRENLSEYGMHRKRLSEESIYNLFKDFKYVIPQGSVMAALGTELPVSLSNCVVLASPLDSLTSIMYTDTQLASLCRRRNGVGFDISNLRPSGLTVNNAAKTTTGPVSFMNRFSETVKTVSQKGRRGALMLTMHINHPDILEFIKIKQDLTQVTGANISVKVSDEFMQAVKNNKYFIHRFPIEANDLHVEEYDNWYPDWDNGELNYIPKDDVYVKVVKARELWNELIKSAHNTAEPGIIFWDTMIDYAPDGVYEKYRPISTNPCFSYDTKILTAEGYRNIGELEGQELDLINAYGKVVKGKVWCSGEKEVIKLTLNRDAKRICFANDDCEEGEVCFNGIPIGVGTYDPIKKGEIKCTPDHKFMSIFEKTVEASELEGEYLSPYHSEYSVFVEKIEQVGIEKVYDFSLSGDTHWGVVEGVIAHNCSEIGMSADSCRLMALNFLSFVENPYTAEAKLNLDKLYDITYEAMRLMDDLVDLELEFAQRILDKVNSDPEPDYIKAPEINTWKQLMEMGKSGRRTGLGFTALADTIAALGYKYDSEEGLAIADILMSVKMEAELTSTIDLAIQRGAFTDWDITKEFNVDGGMLFGGKNDYYNFMLTSFPELTKRMAKYGRRNVSFSTVAPTGSLSILAKTSSGIEPLFQPYYTRRKKINPDDPTTRVDFVDQSGDKWQEYAVMHPQFIEWAYVNGYRKLTMDRIQHKNWMETFSKEELDNLFKKSPWYGSCANDIDWRKRIEMQSLIQMYTSHSISSTLNLPTNTPVKVVGEIYEEAFLHGLKGVTVYRDNSRSGVLVTSTSNSNSEFKYIDAVKRPKKVKGEAYSTKVRGEDYTVFVGLVDDKPYEIFCYKGNGVQGKGEIVKKSRGHYIFEQNQIEFEITDNLTDEQEAITRGYSMALRHGANIKFAVEQLTKTKGMLVDFSKAIARVLKKFIPTSSGNICPECGSSELIYEEGCLKCRCGYSACS